MVGSPIAADSVITVGLGEIRALHDSDDVLAAYGLGSCVAACFWEPVIRMAVMAHVVLPSSEGFDVTQPGKFADLALQHMAQCVVASGGRLDRVVLRIVGGANVLVLPAAPATLQVGDRNVEAVLDAARCLRIPLAGSDVGGTKGRTVRMFGSTGEVRVRTLGGPERVI